MNPTRTLGPFGGLVSALDPGSIPEHCAQDMLNVAVEDGKLKLRRSYRQVASAPANTTACYGLAHLLGYDTNYAQVEEFATVATVSGNTRPYSVHPTTGAMTEIKNGVASVALHASDWAMVPFDQTSYWLNTNNTTPVLKHTIGDATSFTAITNSNTIPSVELVYAVQHSASGASGDPYDRQVWAGITPSSAITNASANVSAVSSTLDGDNLRVALTAGATSFDVALPATKDYSNNDYFIFQFTLQTVAGSGSSQNEVVPTDSFKISFYNGSAYVGAAVQFHRAFQNNAWTYWAYVSTETVARASRTAITRAHVECNVQDKTGWNPLMYLTIMPYWVGMVNCSGSTASGSKRRFAYTYYNSSGTDESQLFGTNTASEPYVNIENAILQGFSPFSSRPSWRLGVWVKFTVTASSDTAIDKDRLYVDDNGTWRRFDEVADGGVSPTTATSYFRLTKTEVSALPAYTDTVKGPFPNMKCAASFKGWMVWGKKGGARNILHSAIGDPERLPSPADLLTDDTRGGQYSLGDNYGDEPVAIFAGGDAVIVFGKQGVYTQFGDRPHSMTPLKRVPGSKGILNQFAACRFRDDYGNPGVAFATRDGIYFIAFSQSFEGDESAKLTELTGDVRDRLGLDALIPVATTVRMVADENQDSLWVIWGDQAYVLRRPSLIDGARRWEPYLYRLYSGDTSLKYAASPVQYGLRVMSNVAHFLEFEFDSANNVYMNSPAYQVAEGGTNAWLHHFWQSKTFTGPNRRVLAASLDPVTVSGNPGRPSVTVVGTERTGGQITQLVASGGGKRALRWGPLVQGRSLSYFLSASYPESDDYEYYAWDSVSIWESSPLSQRLTERGPGEPFVTGVFQANTVSVGLMTVQVEEAGAMSMTYSGNTYRGMLYTDGSFQAPPKWGTITQPSAPDIHIVVEPDGIIEDLVDIT